MSESTVHLTLTGGNAGMVVCGARREDGAEYHHAMYAPLQRAEYRARVCMKCLQLWEDETPEEEEKPAPKVATFDPKIRAALLHALTAYDMRMSAGETKRGHRVNQYRLGHLCGALSRIQERVETGATVRAAILAETCGSVARLLLKAAGCAPMSKDENR
jgi:hypothetical protein